MNYQSLVIAGIMHRDGPMMQKSIVQFGKNKFLKIFIFLMIYLFLCEIIIRIIAPQDLNGQCFEHTDKGLVVNRSKGSSKVQYGNRHTRYNYCYPHLRDTPLKESGIKVLTVGDSFTFGVLLDKANTITYSFQQDADKEFGKVKFNFLNAGTGGWGTADYTAFVEDFGEEIKPDIVLVILNADDIGRSVKSKLFNLTSKTKFDLKRNILKSPYLKRCINLIPGYQWLLEHSHLVQLLKKSWQFFARKGESYKGSTGIIKVPNSGGLKVSSEYSIELGQALFIRLEKWCRDRGVGLYVTTTGWHSLETSGNMQEPTRAFMSTAPEFFKSKNVPFYDISPKVLNLKKFIASEFVFSEGHPNEEGAKLIANSIWQDFLKKQLAEYLYNKRLSEAGNKI